MARPSSIKDMSCRLSRTVCQLKLNRFAVPTIRVDARSACRSSDRNRCLLAQDFASDTSGPASTRHSRQVATPRRTCSGVCPICGAMSGSTSARSDRFWAGHSPRFGDCAPLNRAFTERRIELAIARIEEPWVSGLALSRLRQIKSSPAVRGCFQMHVICQVDPDNLTHFKLAITSMMIFIV